MIRPRLTRLLTLERPARSPDGAGGFEVTWVAQGELWAQLVAGHARLAAGEEVIAPQLGYRVTVRAAAVGTDLRPEAGWRFRENARLFAILAVTEADPEGRYLLCHCREEMAS